MIVGKLPEGYNEVKRLANLPFLSGKGKSLSVLIAITGVVLTLLFWGTLRAAEGVHVNRLTNLAARAIATDLGSDISDRTNALRRMSLVMAFHNPPSASEWNSSATMFMQHYQGCLSVEYADAAYRVRDVVTLDHDPSELGLDLKADPALRTALDAALNRREPTVTPVVFLPSGMKIRTIVVPVFNHDRFLGFVLTKIDFNAALAQILKDVAGLGYLIEVTENGRELYLQPGTDRKLSQRGETVALEMPLGLTWTVRASPTPQLVSEIRTRLPELAALLPLAFTFLVLTILRFAQATGEHAQAMETSNRQMNAALHMRSLAEDEMRESQARFAGILEISSDAIISTNEEQQILLFNRGAEAMFGYKAEEVIGQSLDRLLPSRFQTAHRGHVEEFSNGEYLIRKMTSARTVQGLRKDSSEFPLEASISKLEFKGERIYTAILRDVSERQRAEEELRRAHNELEVKVQERTAELERMNEVLLAEVAERRDAEDKLRQLSGMLLQTQDEERRRVARELHDSTAQYLAALSLNIAAVQVEAPELPTHLREFLSDSSLLVDRCTAEIRSLSYLLHPPLLDDLGLTSALQWYAAGFTKRSGVDVQLELSPDIDRLPADHERAYFRIVQECLTNVRRHSGATKAKIRLTRDEHSTLLEVTDNGCGMPGISTANNDDGALLGVGIAGMRERMRQLGGRLEINSTSEGSVVSAVFSLPSDTSSAGASA